MHHHIIYYNNPSIEGISLVHNKHGNLVSRECYIHIQMDASPYGIGDSGGNFSGKYYVTSHETLRNSVGFGARGFFPSGNLPATNGG